MNLLTQIRNRNTLLYQIALFHIVLAGITALLMMVDTTQVAGVNRWIKPFKFDVSVSIYLLTIAWLSAYLPTNWIRKISLQIAICLLIEIILIHLQAARGVKSHFNRESIDGGIIYAIMGIFILYNTVLVVLITIKFFKIKFDLPPLYLKGIRFGLLSFLLGSFLAMYMSSSPGHTVGAPDGGAGLPFLNWSTTVGDLRVMHFLGIHGLQLFILLGAYLSRPNNQSSRNIFILNGLFLVFIGMVIATFIQALLAKPFISL
ncbi:MAG: hypothetical protein U0Y10_17045 [Spirosomataceae bacterium]